MCVDQCQAHLYWEDLAHVHVCLHALLTCRITRDEKSQNHHKTRTRVNSKFQGASGVVQQAECR